MEEIAIVRGLSDEQVVLCLTRCVQDDRHVTVRLLVHLAEVDARGLFRDHGFPSMFDYAVRRLHMSESEAMLRISVARLGREFPGALELLGRGELHLTALRLLAPVLTQDNIGLLRDARFKSKKQILELLAQLAPRPDVPVSIRRLPEPRLAPTRAALPATTAPAPCFDFDAPMPCQVSAQDPVPQAPPIVAAESGWRPVVAAALRSTSTAAVVPLSLHRAQPPRLASHRCSHQRHGM